MRPANFSHVTVIGPAASSAYRLAFELGMMLTISANGSRPWRRDLLDLFTTLSPYRLVISLYGAT